MRFRRQTQTFREFAVTIAMSFMLAQCGGSSGIIGSSSDSTSTDGSNEQTTDTVIGGNVATMSITNGSASMDLSDVTADEDIMMVVYSYNESSTSSSFQIVGSENEKVQLVDGFTSFLGVGEDEDLTEAFHGELREREEYLDGELVQSGSGQGLYAVSNPTVGSQDTFKVLNSFSSSDSYDTVTATLRVQNSYFNLYVDDRNEDSMSDAELQDIANQFAEVIPLERDIFGSESDVNEDGRFDILLTQTVNSLGGSGGIVTGFFYAVDLYPASTYAVSNEREVYFTFVPDPTGQYGSEISKSFAISNIYPGVFAHEYQHMINFNMHYNVNGGSAESSWLNEGLAHMAEDIYSANGSGYFEEAGLENPARVSSYLSSIGSTCFTCGTSLKQRGGSYLFVRYLYEQAEQGAFNELASGNDFLTAVLDTNLRGVENLTTAIYGASASDTAFKDLLGLFGLAVYFSNTDASDDARFHFTGINLRSAQDDNRGTVLNGPSIQTISNFPFTDSLTGNTVSYIQASGETIQGSGGTLEFEFSTNSDFGGYVVRE